MNIFYLDEDPHKAAKYLCDKHVVKMVLETAQLLCSAHHAFKTATPEMYSATHINHPCAIWVRTDYSHYEWLHRHFIALLIEYTARYKKVHSCTRLVKHLLHPPKHIRNGLYFTPPPQVMPDQYKTEDTVEAYRKYYIGEKLSFAKWSYSDAPYWLQNKQIS